MPTGEQTPVYNLYAHGHWSLVFFCRNMRGTGSAKNQTNCMKHWGRLVKVKPSMIPSKTAADIILCAWPWSFCMVGGSEMPRAHPNSGAQIWCKWDLKSWHFFRDWHGIGLDFSIHGPILSNQWTTPWTTVAGRTTRTPPDRTALRAAVPRLIKVAGWGGACQTATRGALGRV